MDLFLTAAIKDNPGIEGAPVIIGGEGEEVKKGAIIAVSPEAMALGLRPGGSMRRAMKAVPGVAALLPRYDASRALSDKFFLILNETTSLMESFGPDEAFLSITQRGTAPGGDKRVYLLADKLAAEVRGRIEDELGLHTLIGIAPNKPLARLAGLSAKKDGIVRVSKNNASAFIKGLPIKKLPSMDKEGERLLKALGMATVEELSKTPLLFFEKNFGKSGGRVIFESARAWSAVLNLLEERPIKEDILLVGLKLHL